MKKYKTIAITSAHQKIGRRHPRMSARCSGGSNRLSLFQINPCSSDSDLGFVSRLTMAHTAMQIRSQSFRVIEMLTAMAAIYWLLGYPQAKIADWIHKKFGVTE